MVELPAFRQYDNEAPGRVDSMHLRDIPLWLVHRFEDAFVGGQLPKVMGHYTAALAGAEVFPCPYCPPFERFCRRG